MNGFSLKTQPVTKKQIMPAITTKTKQLKKLNKLLKKLLKEAKCFFLLFFAFCYLVYYIYVSNINAICSVWPNLRFNADTDPCFLNNPII